MMWTLLNIEWICFGTYNFIEKYATSTLDSVIISYGTNNIQSADQASPQKGLHSDVKLKIKAKS